MSQPSWIDWQGPGVWWQMRELGMDTQVVVLWFVHVFTFQPFISSYILHSQTFIWFFFQLLFDILQKYILVHF